MTTNDTEARGDATRFASGGDGTLPQFFYAPTVLPAVYRPAALVECAINFRSLRAGINHSEERAYTAWLHAGERPVDWDEPAVARFSPDSVRERPTPGMHVPAFDAPSRERLGEIETELVDALVRRERLEVFVNPLFQIYSDVGETSEEFVARTADAALTSLEPELKKLKTVFDMRLEQVRESQRRKRKAESLAREEEARATDGQAELERLLLRRTEFFEAEKHLASIFTGRADSILKFPALRSRGARDVGGATAELHEDLIWLEQEASEALTDLYARYLDMVRTHDTYEIGIQPNNVRVVRRALLWVPVAP